LIFTPCSRAEHDQIREVGSLSGIRQRELTIVLTRGNHKQIGKVSLVSGRFSEDNPGLELGFRGNFSRSSGGDPLIRERRGNQPGEAECSNKK